MQIPWDVVTERVGEGAAGRLRLVSRSREVQRK